MKTHMKGIYFQGNIAVFTGVTEPGPRGTTQYQYELLTGDHEDPIFWSLNEPKDLLE